MASTPRPTLSEVIETLQTNSDHVRNVMGDLLISLNVSTGLDKKTKADVTTMCHQAIDAVNKAEKSIEILKGKQVNESKDGVLPVGIKPIQDAHGKALTRIIGEFKQNIQPIMKKIGDSPTQKTFFDKLKSAIGHLYLRASNSSKEFKRVQISGPIIEVQAHDVARQLGIKHKNKSGAEFFEGVQNDVDSLENRFAAIKLNLVTYEGPNKKIADQFEVEVRKLEDDMKKVQDAFRRYSKRSVPESYKGEEDTLKNNLLSAMGNMIEGLKNASTKALNTKVGGGLFSKGQSIAQKDPALASILMTINTIDHDLTARKGPNRGPR